MLRITRFSGFHARKVFKNYLQRQATEMVIVMQELSFYEGMKTLDQPSSEYRRKREEMIEKLKIEYNR